VTAERTIVSAKEPLLSAMRQFATAKDLCCNEILLRNDKLQLILHAIINAIAKYQTHSFFYSVKQQNPQDFSYSAKQYGLHLPLHTSSKREHPVCHS
jgi:hypothetical protein